MKDRLIEHLPLSPLAYKGLKELDVVFLSQLMLVQPQSLYKAPTFQKKVAEKALEEVIQLQQEVRTAFHENDDWKRSGYGEHVPTRSALRLGMVLCPEVLDYPQGCQIFFESKKGLAAFDLALSETGIPKAARDPLIQTGFGSCLEVFNMPYDLYQKIISGLSEKRIRSIEEYFQLHTIIEVSSIPVDVAISRLAARAMEMVGVEADHIVQNSEGNKAVPAEAVPDIKVPYLYQDPKTYQEVCRRWQTAITRAAAHIVKEAEADKNFSLEKVLEMSDRSLKSKLQEDEELINLMQKLVAESFPAPFAECRLEEFPWPNRLFPVPLQQKLLSAWVRTGFLQENPFVPGLFQLIQIQLEDWVRTLTPQRRQILLGVLEGKSDQETADSVGLTLSRTRQILNTLWKQMPPMEFQRYSPWLKRYCFYYEDARIVFGISWPEYNLLKASISRFLWGTSGISAILEQDQVPARLKEKVWSALCANYTCLDGSYVRIERNALMQEFARLNYSQQSGSIYGFYEGYLQFLRDHHLDQHKELRYSTPENFEREIREKNFVIFSSSNMLRYYLIDSRDPLNLVQQLNLKKWNNLEISALKLYREYPVLMKEYDFQDEYELHNFLYKTREIWQSLCSAADLSCPPLLAIGRTDLVRQIDELLETEQGKQVDNLKDFADLYEQKYGIKALTFMETGYAGLSELLKNRGFGYSSSRSESSGKTSDEEESETSKE